MFYSAGRWPIVVVVAGTLLFCACATTGSDGELSRRSLEGELAQRLTKLTRAGGVRTKDVARVVLNSDLPIPSETRETLLSRRDIALPDGETKAYVLGAVAATDGCDKALDLSAVSKFGRGLLVATPCFQPVFEFFQYDARHAQGAGLNRWTSDDLWVALRVGPRIGVERFLDAASTLLLDLPPTGPRTLAIARLSISYHRLGAPNRSERLGAQALASLPQVVLEPLDAARVLAHIGPGLAESAHLGPLVAAVHPRVVPDDVRLFIGLLAAQRQLPKIDVTVQTLIAKVAGGAPWIRAHIAALLGDRPEMTRWLKEGLKHTVSALASAKKAVVLGADGAVAEALERSAQTKVDTDGGANPHALAIIQGAVEGAIALKDWPAANQWVARLGGVAQVDGEIALGRGLGEAGELDRAQTVLTAALSRASALQAERIASVAAGFQDFELTLRAVAAARTSNASWLGALLSLADGAPRGLWPSQLEKPQRALWIAAVL